MRAVGMALLVLLALTGCTGTAPSDGPPDGTASPAPESPAAAAATTAPTETAPAEPTPIPTEDPQLTAALAGLATAEAMVALVRQGELEQARGLVYGDSPLDWEPSATLPWSEEYSQLRKSAAWYQQLFDVDGPSSSEIDEWLAAADERADAFRRATGTS